MFKKFFSFSLVCLATISLPIFLVSSCSDSSSDQKIVNKFTDDLISDLNNVHSNDKNYVFSSSIINDETLRSQINGSLTNVPNGFEPKYSFESNDEEGTLIIEIFLSKNGTIFKSEPKRGESLPGTGLEGEMIETNRVVLSGFKIETPEEKTAFENEYKKFDISTNLTTEGKKILNNEENKNKKIEEIFNFDTNASNEDNYIGKYIKNPSLSSGYKISSVVFLSGPDFTSNGREFNVGILLENNSGIVKGLNNSYKRLSLF